VWLDEGAHVDPTALSGSVILGRGAQIAARARVANSVIGPETVIRPAPMSRQRRLGRGGDQAGAVVRSRDRAQSVVRANAFWPRA
jgi:hypothetical protein